MSKTTVTTFLLACACALMLPVSASAQGLSKPDYEKMLKHYGPGTNTFELVKPGELQEYLPQVISGLELDFATGKQSKGYGFNTVYAQALFRSAVGNQTLEVKISDMTAMKGLMEMAREAWAKIDQNSDTDEAMEQTYSLNGQKCYVRQDKKSGNIDFTSIVANRFTVDINGFNVTLAQLNEARDQVDFAALLDWATELEEKKESP